LLLIGSGSDGVRNRMSRAIMTCSGLNGTNPAPQNLPWILLGVIAAL
jgi:hypothetical protein